MELSLFEVGIAALGLGGVVGGALGWAWGASRARAVAELALRDAEKRASAAGARADTLADHARESEARANGLEAARRIADSEKSARQRARAPSSRAASSSSAPCSTAPRPSSPTRSRPWRPTRSKRATRAFWPSRPSASAPCARRSAGDLEARQKAIEGVVTPMRESLDKVDQQIRALESARGQAYGELSAQVRAMATTHDKLRAGTNNLVNALRAPAVRGRWGELQLRRVVEMAGMLENCDFEEQASVTTEDGRLRPDMVVRLPSGRNIVIDAKTPLGAYLEAQEATTDEDRAAKLLHHAVQVRAHVAKLAAKNYWEQFAVAPEVVVMFLPGETFYSVALEQMPDLIEAGFAQNVLIATPTTLLGLLRAVSAGWREERIAENAQRISDEGRRLHERIATLAEKLSDLGRFLGQAVGAYNGTVATFDARVLPTARTLASLDAKGKKEMVEPTMIDERPRSLRKIEPRRVAPLTLALSPAPAVSAADQVNDS